MNGPPAAGTSPGTGAVASARTPARDGGPGTRTTRPALPLRWGLSLLVATVLVCYGAVGFLAMRAAQDVAAAEATLAERVGGRQEIAAAMAGMETARADLTSALAGGIGGSAVAADIAAETDAAHDLIEAAAARPLPADLTAAVAGLHASMDDLGSVIDMGRTRLGAAGAESVAAALGELRRAGSVAQSAYADVDEALDSSIARAAADVARARSVASRALVTAALLASVVVLGVGVLVVRGVRRRLRHIGDVATRVGDGDLEARASVRARDEIGRIARALNNAVAVQRDLVARLGADAERVRLSSGLDQAFDMVDREPQVHALVGRALGELLPDRPGEMLLADASRAHLEVVSVNPRAAAPTCPVAFPYDCIAVRRGSLQTFPSSADLSACPKLAAPAEEPVSATCVPVTFMGRALGVIHTTAPAGEDWDPDRLALLGQVATLAGSRIGTIRTFERTQIQAETDGLTGLPNRRTFESRARALLERDGPLSLAILDLDHFKLLNDTYGHEAGDRALRAFAGVVRAHLREDDLVARIGGEEFAVVMPRTPVEHAREVLDRVRAELVETAVGEAPAVTVSAGLVGRRTGDTLDALLREADRALYRAKRTGRDRVVVAEFDDESDVPPRPPREYELDVPAQDPDVPAAGAGPDDDSAWPWSVGAAGFVSAATADDGLPGGDR